MKIRSGFVSNSSSSSFIFKVNSAPPCKCCGRSSEDAIDILNAMTQDDGEDEEALPILEEISKRVSENPNWKCYEEKWVNENPDKFDNINDVYTVCLSYHNYGREAYLKESGNFEILDTNC